MRLNKKGFSLIELMVVVAMLSVLLATSTGAFVTIWHARASKGANTIDAMLAQSKISSLSGDENYVKISFDGSDYYVELWHDGESKPYKQETVGNKQLTVNCDNNEINETTSYIVRFNRRTGSIEFAGKSDDDPAATVVPNTIYITVEHGSTYTITLWKRTGEHTVS